MLAESRMTILVSHAEYSVSHPTRVIHCFLALKYRILLQDW